MATGRRKQSRRRREQGCRAARIGDLLLDLHQGLRKIEECRRELKDLGFSHERWQEIVNDVDPELRFGLRPKMLDEIVKYLQGAAEPVRRDVLVRELAAQGAGLVVRVRQSIAAHLRNKSLTLFPDDKIGLPAWKKDVPRSG
jgi:hypothetical protein